MLIDPAVLILANGFLPTRGSWMLDFVVIAMLLVIVVMAFSIAQVRYKQNRQLHRNIQIATAIALTIALLAFEIDVRFFTDWREIAKPSPYYDSGWVGLALTIHLCFAIPTPVIWGVVIAMALRRFSKNFDQAAFNQFHRVSGRIAAAMMLATAITGWIFYYVAFVA